MPVSISQIILKLNLEIHALFFPAYVIPSIDWNIITYTITTNQVPVYLVPGFAWCQVLFGARSTWCQVYYKLVLF